MTLKSNLFKHFINKRCYFINNDALQTIMKIISQKIKTKFYLNIDYISFFKSYSFS